MKLFKALLILSIGMMVSTVSASPTPEKKQDTRFVLNKVAPIEITSLQVLELNSEALVLVSTNAINAPLIFESFEYHYSKSIGEVGWNYDKKLNKSKPLNIISCQKLEQSSFVNQLQILKVQKRLILEPYSELKGKIQILQNIHQTVKSKSTFPTTQSLRMHLFQERITT